LAKYTVQYYELSLGDQDPTTGWPKPGWVATAIDSFVFPKGSTRVLTMMGIYCRLDAVGFTDYKVMEGGVIRTQDLTIYKIVGDPEPWYDGNVFSHYKVDLAKMLTFPVPADYGILPPDSHFFGFEIIDVTHKFEDGFERGWT
jgi:hypothetical protein